MSLQQAALGSTFMLADSYPLPTQALNLGYQPAREMQLLDIISSADGFAIDEYVGHGAASG